MRVLGLTLAGVLALSAPWSRTLFPLGGKPGPAAMGPGSGIVNAWGGCSWGWHPVPGHWSQWRGGWVPRIVRRTAKAGAWEVLTAIKATRMPAGAHMAADKAPTEVGATTAGVGATDSSYGAEHWSD